MQRYICLCAYPKINNTIQEGEIPMAVNLDSYINNYFNPYSQAGGVSSTPDLGALQSNSKKQAAELLASYEANKTTTTTLKKDTSSYLDKYVLSMKTMDQNTGKLRNGGLDKILYDKDGNVTDASVEETVKATQSMVNSYNSTLKLLNDNAERGAGTVKQLARMVTDPAPAKSMEMVGITVKKDGTLELDAAKLTEALKTTDKNQLSLYKDILGGYGGVADGIHKDALYGTNMSAKELVGNDLANIQAKRQENPFSAMYSSIKGNVYTLNNQAVTGMMMNMFV